MLSFECTVPTLLSITSIREMEYASLLSLEVDFKLFINNSLFFQDKYFPILEFVRYADLWLASELCDFEFNTIESEDNPLLAFYKHEQEFSINSVWEIFHCDLKFTTAEVRYLVFSIINGTTKIDLPR